MGGCCSGVKKFLFELRSDFDSGTSIFFLSQRGKRATILQVLKLLAASLKFMRYYGFLGLHLPLSHSDLCCFYGMTVEILR